MTERTVEVRSAAEIYLNVQGEEVIKHCATREDYHRGREKFFTEEATKFKDEELQTGPAATYSNRSIVSVRAELEQKARNHRDKARFFAFARGHVDPKAVFSVTRSTLAEWEFVAAPDF